MGYSHYWEVPNSEKTGEGLEKALPVVRDIIQRYRDIVCREFDTPNKKPTTTKSDIRLNGKDEDGHETFIFSLTGGKCFCKTNEKPYDIVVCEILLVLQAFIPDMRVSSDGFNGSYRSSRRDLEGNWKLAQNNVRRQYQLSNPS
jgi:hypothetical protein